MSQSEETANMPVKFAMRCAAICLVVLCQGVLAVPLNERCSLPPALGSEIRRKYPDTTLVNLKDLNAHDRKLFEKDHGVRCPGLVKVDFYGDGRPTWAIVLLHHKPGGGETELVVAHQFNNAWEIHSLDRADEVAVVWTEAPGEYRDVYGDKTLRATRPVIVLCGYGSWAILYAWTGREVEKIWISD